MDWRVYHIQNFIGVDPPKNKFLLVFRFADGMRGFLINTNIAKFFAKRGLLPCVATIPADTNPFLDYDSHIDCSRLFFIEDYSLYDMACPEVCDYCKHNVLKAIMACRTLTPAEKLHILSQYATDYFKPGKYK